MLYIWQDLHDTYTYHFGAKYGNGEFVWWFTMHCDGLDDCFGDGIGSIVHKMDFSEGPQPLDMHQFVKQEAIEEEREACALLSESWNPKYTEDENDAPWSIANAIRNRK